MFFNLIASKAAWSYGGGKILFNPSIRAWKIYLSYYRPGGIPYRKHPGMFRSLRNTTRMLGPCCLCPLIDENGPDYVEAAMYMAAVGTFAGKYVISCAKDRCGYLGK